MSVTGLHHRWLPLCAVFIATTPALAAPATGNSFERSDRERGATYSSADRPMAIADAETATVRKKFARCVYQRRAAQIDTLLASQDQDDEIARLAGNPPIWPGEGSDSAFSRCLGAAQGLKQLRVSFDSATFRVMMAEEAYLSRFQVAPSLPAGAPELLPRPASLSTTTSAPSSTALLTAVADCIVFRNTTGADTLVRTHPGSGAERAAAIGLATAFGGCLPKGQTLKVNTQKMRALAADGLWARYARTLH